MKNEIRIIYHKCLEVCAAADELLNELREFTHGQLRQAVVQAEPENEGRTIKFVLRNVPDVSKTHVFTGFHEALSNYKEILDGLVYALTLASNPTFEPPYEPFPISPSQGEFAKDTVRLRKAVGSNAMIALGAVQPYRSDNPTNHPLNKLKELLDVSVNSGVELEVCSAGASTRNVASGLSMSKFIPEFREGCVLAEANSTRPFLKDQRPSYGVVWHMVFGPNCGSLNQAPVLDTLLQIGAKVRDIVESSAIRDLLGN